MPASHQSEDILLRINSLNTLIQKYVSQIRSLDVNWDRAAHDAGLMTETELRNKLQTPSPQLRIGVIGRVKAGKSSLLNGLLFNGEEVLPKAATPMTAALTILTYGEHFQAEVDFYDDKELADIKRLHSQYEAKFAEELALLKKEQTAPPKTAPLGRHPNHLARNGNQINRAKSPDALQRQVKLKMDQDVHLSGAYVLYEDMRSAGLSSAPRGQKKLSARNLDELQNMLHDYVGASGSFTPWTKSLCIRLPYESLRNLEIVDTPGVNDPVASREVRTQKELQNCAAVLVVSPAAQFLSQDDFNLLDRLGSNAIAEVYLVASQIDTQLSTHTTDSIPLRGQLEELRTVLSTHAKDVITQKVQEQHLHGGINHGLSSLHAKLSDRLLFSSGHAAAMLTLPSQHWDEEHQHTFSRLKRCFPADFSNERQNAALTLLAGVDGLLESIEDVRGRRQLVLRKQLSDLAEAQTHAFNQSVEMLVQTIEGWREQISSGDIERLKSQLDQLQRTRKTAIKAIKAAFVDTVDKFAEEVGSDLQKIVERFFDQRQSKAASAQRLESETYEIYKDGLWNGIGQALGNVWGTETRHRDVIKITGSQLRDALEGTQRELENKSTKLLQEKRSKFREDLRKTLTSAARSSMADENIDADKLSEAVRTVIQRLPEPPDFEFPSLPEELQLSGELRGSTAENALSAAKKYLEDLERQARKEVNKTERTLAKLCDDRPGDSILDDYTEEIEQRRNELQDRQASLNRYDKLISEIHDI